VRVVRLAVLAAVLAAVVFVLDALLAPEGPDRG